MRISTGIKTTYEIWFFEYYVVDKVKLPIELCHHIMSFLGNVSDEKHDTNQKYIMDNLHLETRINKFMLQKSYYLFDRSNIPEHFMGHQSEIAITIQSWLKLPQQITIRVCIFCGEYTSETFTASNRIICQCFSTTSKTKTIDELHNKNTIEHIV